MRINKCVGLDAEKVGKFNDIRIVRLCTFRCRISLECLVINTKPRKKRDGYERVHLPKRVVCI